jgi:hypothetical protein
MCPPTRKDNTKGISKISRVSTNYFSIKEVLSRSMAHSDNSSLSVNNDWKNWMVLHGNDDV